MGLANVSDRGPTEFKELKNTLRILAYRCLAIKNLIWRRGYRWWCLLKGRTDLVSWKVLDLKASDVPCFCISLMADVSAAERRSQFSKRAAKWGWNVQFWNAIDARTWSVEQYPEWLQSRKENGELLGPGEVGLLCSMRELLEHARAEGTPYLVILEDDAMIHAAPRLEIPEEFDLVFFNNRFCGDATGRVKTGWGTDGYLISQRGLDKLLILLQGANKPADVLLQHQIAGSAENDPSKPLLQAYHIGPLVTHDHHFESFIAGVEQEPSSSKEST